MNTPASPDPADLPPAPGVAISVRQLTELAQCMGSSDAESLWALHRDMLLGTGNVLARDNGSVREFVLEVPTESGIRWVAMDGEVLESCPLGPPWSPTDWSAEPLVCPKTSRGRGQGMMSTAGVGLLFRTTTPLTASDQEELVEAMWGFSCHPYLGRRIVSDLMEHGVRAATVMPHLLSQLPQMSEIFGKFGVSVTQCWPMPSRGHPNVPTQEQSVPPPRFIPPRPR